MKIHIVGAGAIGGLFAGLLTEGGVDVTLIDKRQSRCDLLNKRGWTIQKSEGKRNVKINIVSYPLKTEPPDLVVIAVKSFDTEKAVKGVAHILSEDTAVVTIQNGLGNIEKIQSLVKANRILGGVTMQASTLIKLGEVFHAADGLTYFGDLSGEVTPELDEIKRTFGRAGIRLEVSRNITELMWSKLLANASINPLTALMGIKNSGLLNRRWLTHVMTEVISEGVNVAKAKGIKLSIRKTVQDATSIAKLTGSNKSSMLQDIEKRKRTEIDTINGAIAMIGKEVHVKTPVNSLLTRLVREVEGGELRSSVKEKAATLLKSI